MLLRHSILNLAFNVSNRQNRSYFLVHVKKICHLLSMLVFSLLTLIEKVKKYPEIPAKSTQIRVGLIYIDLSFHNNCHYM